MWHTIEFVAESRNLNPEALGRFALENKDKYGILQERGSALVEVNTWHVDQLVEEFRKAEGKPTP